jgi:dihydrofolate reductase
MKGDLAESVRRLKAEAGPEMVIMGSGSIVAQLSKAGLIDEYQVVLTPVAIGGGRSMFEGLEADLPLRLGASRVFPHGKVWLSYEPKR